MKATATTALVVCLAACNSTWTVTPTPGANGFDAAQGQDWRFASTGGEGPSATWQAHADQGAVSAPNVMSMVAPNHRSEDRFNLCWSATPKFVDGRLSLAVRADRGEIDRGGGPMWRVQDDDNYYVCRWNPLEHNFRVYVVRRGVRFQLATAIVSAAPAAWHRIEVEHQGARIRCWLDGEKLLEANDATIPGAGGVGLWTKADACTSFDDLVVRPGASSAAVPQNTGPGGGN
ncbi:MAG TPA: hypothetical protein VF384_14955 [Planctomycetota bacterium]